MSDHEPTTLPPIEVDYQAFAIELWNNMAIGPLAQVPADHGEYVLYVLKHLDHLANVYSKGGKWIRREQRPHHCIGGYKAHKMFRYKIDETNKVYYIWRIQ